jgi:hypothetical protein
MNLYDNEPDFRAVKKSLQAPLSVLSKHTMTCILQYHIITLNYSSSGGNFPRVYSTPVDITNSIFTLNERK